MFPRHQATATIEGAVSMTDPRLDHTHSFPQPSSPSTHLVSSISTVSDLKMLSHGIKQLYTAPLPISTLRASQRAALPLFSLGSTASLTPTHPSNVKTRPSRLSIRHHPPVLGSITARRDRQPNGRERRPRWLSFTCAIRCSVPVPAILDLPAHRGPAIN